MADNNEIRESTGLEVAVIGMACRFPGAADIYEFWENLKNGIEAISFFNDEELVEEGADPNSLKEPNFVRAKGILQDIDFFDASFFGYTPAEAELMDPQLRIFYECAWWALEHAGYSPNNFSGNIGLIGGANNNRAWETRAFLSGKTAVMGAFAANHLIDKDFLCTRIAYRLDFTGPAIAINTACSTALMAVDLACRTLLTGQCDIALAGGVSVPGMKKSGYFYREGMILSPDGHCRAFDAQAEGVVFSDGAGLVVLKRLEEAVMDGDNILAVILGSAINNDGIVKGSFTAPGVKGQAAVIQAAHHIANVDPETISYVETHGTGTTLGDPVEVEGLIQAFDTDKRNYCAIGSVKSNFGHLDTAAGAASMIKTVLALKYKYIPPSLHFQKHNPEIDFENSPFYVNAGLKEWQSRGQPLRAGISAFGVGGTNVHVVLEEAEEREPSSKSREYQLVLLSAKTAAALEQMSGNFPGYLDKIPKLNLADAAYSLQVGRSAFKFRQMFVASGSADVIACLTPPDDTTPFDTGKVFRGKSRDQIHPVFMFSGQGSQYVDMGLELYRKEQDFAEEMDRCFEIFQSAMGYDIKEVLYPELSELRRDSTNSDELASGGQLFEKSWTKTFDEEQETRPVGDAYMRPGEQERRGEPCVPPSLRAQPTPTPARERNDINRTEIAQPVIFIIEYALAKLLMRWGITPYAMIGHSIGEYTAACLSGVFSLKDALKIVALRGKLMQRMQPGSMVSVPLPETEVVPLLSEELELAAVNAPGLCVVSGPDEAIDHLIDRLNTKKIKTRILHTSHAFHSKSMEPMLKEFSVEVAKFTLNRPGIPYISNLSGTWITVEQAVDPGYWSDHLRRTVRFADGLTEILKDEHALLLEVGPGRTLSTFVRQHPGKRPEQMIVNLMRHPNEDISDSAYLLDKIGRLWLNGQTIDWMTFYSREKRNRVPLPLYPFQGESFWISRDVLSGLDGMGLEARAETGKKKDVDRFEGSRQEEEPGGAKHSRPDISSVYVPPRTQMEKRIAGLFREQLGIDGVGIDDDFFELGGHSLTAMTLASGIHKEFDIDIPLGEIFNTPHIRGLAAYIKKSDRSKHLQVDPVEKKEYYHLSSAQRRLYILQRMDAEMGTAYNLPALWQLEGEISKEKLESSFRQLIRRHEDLRTFFTVIDNEPVQRVKEKVTFKIERVAPAAEDITERSSSHKELRSKARSSSKSSMEGVAPAADESFIQPFTRSFDLSKAPLMRVGFTEIDEQKHILMVDMHHIIADGQSMGILVKDFIELYAGRNLPGLRLQYKDFCHWQNRLMQRESIKQQETYWINQFSGEIPVLELPTDYPRPAMQDFTGTAINFEIDKEETAALNALVRQHGVTMFMLLLSVYTVFLCKLSGQEDIVVGTPTAGRRHTDLQGIIGMFVNTLALRNFPVMEKTFYMFLQELKENTVKAFENQDYQYEDLVEQVNVARDTGRNPLFDAMLNLQTNDTPAGQTLELNAAPYNYESRISKFDLTLEAVEIHDRLTFTFEYCTKLFKPETIERFTTYFRRIVSSVGANPLCRLADIEIITGAEKRQLLKEFNDRETSFPAVQQLSDLFIEQANRVPDRTALVFEDYSLTYRELERKSRILAALLREKGVLPDTVAAIMAKRSAALVVGVLGILQAGGAYLPIDTGCPAERIHYILKDSDAFLLLTGGTSPPPVEGCEILPIDTVLDGEDVDDRDGMGFAPQTGSTNLAYVIYTSGTTGRPRGVMIEHRAVADYIRWAIKTYVKGENLNFPFFTPLSFDLTVTSLFTPLLSGNRLVVYGEEENRFILNRIVDENMVDIMKLTPSHLKFIREKQMAVTTPAIKRLIVGGEELETALTADIVRNFGGNVEVYNEYGPTETAVGSMIYKYEPGRENKITLSIGKPADNTGIFILDRNLKLLPVGIQGEICILGVGMARGYLNNPELTSEKFIASGGPPFCKKVGPKTFHEGYSSVIPSPGGVPRSGGVDLGASKPRDLIDAFIRPIDLAQAGLHAGGEILYRTGDLGRRQPDGNIEFLGRMDHQVKIRGFRIELEEIEKHLHDHESIREAVVLTGEQDEDKYLCAYITAAGELDVSGLREYLSRDLPDYMIPAYFVQIDKIPLTPNGKVDRNALTKHKGKRLETGTSYVAPSPGIEKKVADLWKEVLNLDKVGIHDNFFDLGGNSLRAIVIASGIHKEFDIDIPLGEIFNTPHIRGLAAYIKKSARIKYLQVDPVEKKEYYSLSSAQRRLYILQQIDAEIGTAYNIPALWQLEGEISIKKLERSFRQLIRRHEDLRTFFTMVNNEPVQRVKEKVTFKIERTAPAADDVTEQSSSHKGLRSKTEFSSKSSLERVTPAADDVTEQSSSHKELRSKTEFSSKSSLEGVAPAPNDETFFQPFIRPFDLSKAPLLRVGLTEIDEQKHILMVDMHHIISDGQSLGILIRDFIELYAGRNLPGLRLQYKDFCLWQYRWAGKESIKQQEAYWINQFSGETPVLELPTDYPRPAVQDFTGTAIYFEIDKEETAALNALVRKHGVTMFMLLLSVYTVFLCKLSGQEDVVVGTPTAGRRHSDLHGIIGMFVNMLALRNFPVMEKTFTGFLRELKKNTIEAYDNQDYQYEDLVEQVKVARDTGRNPLFDASFMLQEGDTPTGQISGLKAVPYNYESRISKFDLTLMAVEIPDRLIFTFEYCTKLFKPETIQRFILYFKKTMSTICDNPDIGISEIDIIDEQEKNRILHEFNDTASEYPEDKTIQQLFKEQVESTPDNIALYGCMTAGMNGEEGSITYKELSEKSGRLAYMLIEKGVEPDTLVGIMIQRSVEMIMGIMGILTAGGAYLPIELGYPRERIDYMLKDSGAKLLLTADDLASGGPPTRVGERLAASRAHHVGMGLAASRNIHENQSPVLLKGARAACQKTFDDEQERRGAATSIAYAIYTSGSTGKPKGVLTTHANVTRVVKNTNYIHIDSTDRLLQLSNYAFDGSVFDIYGALLNGAGLVSITEDQVLEIRRFMEVIKRQGVTVFFVTTALFNTLVEVEIGCFQRVRKVLFGGELVSVEHSRKALDYLGKGRVIHVYGPTETTVYATYHFIETIETDASNIPIGKPISNTTVYILGKDLQPVPIGAAGEIYIGGTGVARGYLNNPELTAEKFLGSFFQKATPRRGHHVGRGLDIRENQSPVPLEGARAACYKTGDLARWLPDGSVEFLGRIDQQVKLRGFRIELGEIESHLIKHKEIKEAVVLVQTYENGGKYLCAYISAAGDLALSGIREYLLDRLPGYMIPSEFVLLEKIPLTGSGKLDRKKLKSTGKRLGAGVEHVAPQSVDEVIIAEAWKDVLKLEEVGIYDNFFDMGGTSLDMIRLNSKLTELFNREISIVDMYRYTTIESFAAYLEGGKRETENTPAVTRSQARVDRMKRGMEDKNKRREIRTRRNK